MIRQLNVTLMLVCLGVFGPMSAGQSVSELTIDGMPTIIENTALDYKAVACLADGTEHDVTAMTDWWMVHHADARIDERGRLTAGEVDEDQSITIWASFTDGRITRHAARKVRIVNVLADEGEDPWPFWGRTATRIGNTSTVGPQTPTIEWSVQISFFPFENILEASPVMDRDGRIFVGHQSGITAVDSISREVIWDFTGGDFTRGAAVWGGRVLWGAHAPLSNLYCYDAATGEEVWTFHQDEAIFRAPVVDPDGVVYISDAGGIGPALVHARSIDDGAEVWTREVGGTVFNSVALDWPFLLTSGGGPGGYDLLGLNPFTGNSDWTFGTDWFLGGTVVVDSGRVYVASWDRYVYCVDAETGKEIWRFWCEQINKGAVALGHDGTIYNATSGNVGILFAVTPDGDELWRYELPGLVLNAPIVGGDGTIYVCNNHWTGSFYEARVHAMRPDGTVLWVKQMPDHVGASPMLAPDGTLYVVCRDKYLYAFKDPDVLGDLDGNGSVGAGDLLALLASWGKCPDLPETCPADLDLNGTVGAADLLILLANWG